MIARDVGFVRDLAVDDQFLYFAGYDDAKYGGQPLSRMPKAGGPSTTLIPAEAGTFDITHIELDGNYVYVASYYGAGVRRLPRIGGTAEVIDNCNTALDVRRRGEEIFYTTWVCGVNVRVRKQRVDDFDAAGPGTESEIDTLSYDGGYGFTASGNLGIDTTTVYWQKNTEIRIIPRDLVGAPQVVFAPDGGRIRRMELAGDRLYVMAGTSLWSVPKDGSNPKELVTGLDFEVPMTNVKPNVVVDGDLVYFTSPGDGRVGRVKAGGGPIEIIAENQAQPMGLAVDGTHVYWANTLQGTLLRAPK